METEYKGYQSLHDDFKRYQKQTPKGISLQNKSRYFTFRQKIRNTTVKSRAKATANKYFIEV